MFSDYHDEIEYKLREENKILQGKILEFRNRLKFILREYDEHFGIQTVTQRRIEERDDKNRNTV